MNTYSQYFKKTKFLHEMGLEQRWRGLTTAKFHEIAFRVFFRKIRNQKIKIQKTKKINICIIPQFQNIIP